MRLAGDRSVRGGTYGRSKRSRKRRTRKMVISSQLATPHTIDVAKQAAALRHWCEPIESPLDETFAVPFERFADARIVLLGEATHGTSEFYSARAAITRALIERHGFNIVAVEA